jgi:hypothetical protein
VLDARDPLAAGPQALIVDLSPSANNPSNPSHTAGTTFFGQLVDHDVTFDAGSRLAQQTEPETARNYRTPALDLDSVYGAGPVAQQRAVRAGRPREAEGGEPRLVLHEFLPQIVGQDMVDDVLRRGRRFYEPEPGGAFMPVEFQTGAYRMGHAWCGRRTGPTSPGTAGGRSSPSSSTRLKRAKPIRTTCAAAPERRAGFIGRRRRPREPGQ